MTAGKALLRKYFRRCSTPGDSQRLCRRILSSDWFQKADSLMAYWAIGTEPDLHLVLEAALDQGKTLLLPRCEEDGTMTARRVRDLGELTPGAYGIREPGPEAEIFPPEKLECILTPGVAFDRRGGRLGRGKGYYDRFLPHTNGWIVGVCFGANLLERLPMESHDCPVAMVVTEDETIFCEMEGGVCLGKSAT